MRSCHPVAFNSVRDIAAALERRANGVDVNVLVVQ